LGFDSPQDFNGNTSLRLFVWIGSSMLGFCNSDDDEQGEGLFGGYAINGLTCFMYRKGVFFEMHGVSMGGAID
jgi:hypothetical protein